MRLTELEKTIMLVFLIFTKGTIDKYLSEDFLLSKFVPRQRKMVKKSLRRLTKNNLLVKKEISYSLTKEGLKRASSLLHEGVSIRVRPVICLVRSNSISE